MSNSILVGVLALQGAFFEHIILLKQAALALAKQDLHWTFREVRTPGDLEASDALIIPGGESTTIALVAARSSLLEPLRGFVKVKRKPVWGTCAGLILLAESANRTKKGGQDLIGGLDVKVNRNHFGRQKESFEADVDLPFLSETREGEADGLSRQPFHGVFIRAPVVEKVLPAGVGEQKSEALFTDTVVAPSKAPESLNFKLPDVEVLATLAGKKGSQSDASSTAALSDEAGDIVVVRQGNVFGTSFHPELTDDCRIHTWWLRQVIKHWELEARVE